MLRLTGVVMGLSVLLTCPLQAQDFTDRDSAGVAVGTWGRSVHRPGSRRTFHQDRLRLLHGFGYRVTGAGQVTGLGR